MIKAISRGGQFGAFSKATAQAIPPPSASVLVPATLPPSSKPLVEIDRSLLTSDSLGKAVSSINNFGVISGPGVTTQVRFAHTDVKVPDFTAYRRDSTKSPTSDNDKSLGSRAAFSYLFTAGSLAGAIYGGKGIVHAFVTSMSASADVLAVSTIEVKLSAIPEGQCVTFKWRGKPLFIRHRTQEEISRERAVPLSDLRDPQEDEVRVQKPEWLVVLGVCTHLGCVPIANAGDFGGYYCPCHGSHYDASGRIRKGPAPLNLEVPKYAFTDPDTVLVG
nr:PREDICTED: cytochrome b-c1 complex subunit Rieske, mitochondrial [Bemisia tabaci]